MILRKLTVLKGGGTKTPRKQSCYNNSQQDPSIGLILIGDVLRIISQQGNLIFKRLFQRNIKRQARKILLKFSFFVGKYKRNR